MSIYSKAATNSSDLCLDDRRYRSTIYQFYMYGINLYDVCGIMYIFMVLFIFILKNQFTTSFLFFILCILYLFVSLIVLILFLYLL